MIWQHNQLLKVLVSAVENQCHDKVSVSLRSLAGILFVRKGERAKEKSARKALLIQLYLLYGVKL